MAKKYLDNDGLLYFWQKITNKFVEKDGSKVLSTNDYTTAEKNKLAGISAGAEVNTIDSVKVNGTALTITSKAVDVPVPTKTSDLTNDSNFQENIIETIKVNGTSQTITSKAVDITIPTNNNQLTNGAGYQTSSDVQSLINTAISGITGIDFQIVSSLPSTGVKGVIYLISNSGSGQNIYDEYIWVNNAFEKIGTTAVDLSDYVKNSDLVAITNAEIDTIVAS